MAKKQKTKTFFKVGTMSVPGNFPLNKPLKWITQLIDGLHSSANGVGCSDATEFLSHE